MAVDAGGGDGGSWRGSWRQLKRGIHCCQAGEFEIVRLRLDRDCGEFIVVAGGTLASWLDEVVVVLLLIMLGVAAAVVVVIQVFDAHG